MKILFGILFVFLVNEVSIEIINENTYLEYDEIESCSYSKVKTYMPYDTVTNEDTKQYHLIKNELYITDSGLLKDKYGYIAAALGSYYGEIGDRFIFTLDTGVELHIIKADAKSNHPSLTLNIS